MSTFKNFFFLLIDKHCLLEHYYAIKNGQFTFFDQTETKIERVSLSKPQEEMN